VTDKTEIAAVLLVPTDDDPHGLLAQGPCGARPPNAERIVHAKGEVNSREGGTYTGCTGCKELWPCSKSGTTQWVKGNDLWLNDRDALVLAWEGKPVVEGLTRATMALAEFVSNDEKMILVWHGATMDDVMHMRSACLAEGLGTLVLLDVDGREVEGG